MNPEQFYAQRPRPQFEGQEQGHESDPFFRADPPFYDYGNFDGQSQTDPGIVWSWTWSSTLLSLILIPIVLFTLIGNFLVLYAFITRPRDLRGPSQVFIANLALSDFLVGVGAMPFLATVHITGRWYFGQGFCYAWVIIHFWLCSASILSTLGVCIERWVGVKYPLQHSEIMNKYRMIGGILGIWGIAGLLTLTSVLAFPEPAHSPSSPLGEYECRVNNQKGHVLIATIGILYIPASLMIFFYTKIFIIASKHLRAMKARRKDQEGGGVPRVKQPPQPRPKVKTWSKLNFFRFSSDLKPQPQTDPSTPSRNETSFSGHFNANGNDSTGESGLSYSSFEEVSFSTDDQHPPKVKGKGRAPAVPPPLSKDDYSKKEINLAKRLSLLVGVLLLSYIPFFTAFLIRAYRPSAVPDLLFHTLGWIRYGNSAINPIIYAFAVPNYRKAFQDISKFFYRR